MVKLRKSERLVNGRLSQIGQAFVIRKKQPSTVAVFKCECGEKVVTSTSKVRTGMTKSCGCLAIEILIDKSTKHGMTKKGVSRKTHNAWNAMIQRCINCKVESFSNYGARGITVCDEWMSFEAFLEDMGVAPEGLSIDRIDGTKGYFKSNCRWADNATQALNRRTTIKVTIDGQEKSVSNWCIINKLNRSTVHNRIKSGWDIERAVTEQPSR
jgi:hypothetical protein